MHIPHAPTQARHVADSTIPFHYISVHPLPKVDSLHCPTGTRPFTTNYYDLMILYNLHESSWLSQRA